ncbi:MAG: glycoside hydrolase 5 family protein [Phycisphaerales bacterium]
MKQTIMQYRFGVNYTPARRWYYCWNDWDAGAVARDFDAIAGLGADHIRVMLIWPWFHPNPTMVSEAHLERLSELMDLAGERALDVCVTLLNGWLSGYRFSPVFVRDQGFYNSAETWGFIERYIRAVAGAIGGKRNLLGFDVGNEINCSWYTSDLAEGDAWTDRVLGLAESLVPDGVHVNGVNHGPWFSRTTFSPSALARRQSIIALHTWVEFTGARRRGAPMDPCCLRLNEAMTALARSYAGEAAKPVWIQEYGMSEDWMDAADIAAFVEGATLAGIAGGASWFTWWASHDIDRSMDFDSVEYSLGLLTAGNKPKPQAGVFRRIAEAYRGKPVQVKQQGRPLSAPPRELTHEETWVWLEKWLADNAR